MTDTVSGSSKGVSEARGNLHANILLKPDEVDGYWVYGPLFVGQTGAWSHKVNFGTSEENLPHEYQILAIVTREPLKAQDSGGEDPEYRTLPPHVAVSDMVQLKREKY